MLGVLEIAGRGSGFLRRREASYLPSNGDVHVGERLIRQYGLRVGDEVDGTVRPPTKGKSPSLDKITTIQIADRAGVSVGDGIDVQVVDAAAARLERGERRFDDR